MDLQQLRSPHAGCGQQSTERMGPLRHAGERFGVDVGLVRSRIARWYKSARPSNGFRSCASRRLLGRQRRRRASGGSQQQRPVRPRELPRLSPRQVGAIGETRFLGTPAGRGGTRPERHPGGSPNRDRSFRWRAAKIHSTTGFTTNAGARRGTTVSSSRTAQPTVACSTRRLWHHRR
jgi:hypothetical protein